MTREEWLIEAVGAIDRHVYSNDLDTANHGYQIGSGKCPGKKIVEIVQPSDSESVTLEDFFPTTISINYQLDDPIDIMTHLAHACIPAFKGLKKGKTFKKYCDRFYWEEPYKEPHPSQYLRDLIKDAYDEVVFKCGDYPGKAVKFPVKEKKECKSNKVIFFCPECGWEVYTTKKQMQKRNGYPTCICGTRMGIDQSNAEQDANEDNP